MDFAPFVKMASMCASSRMTDRSFGTTSVIELSEDPVMVQLPMVSHMAMWCRCIMAAFSSTVSGTGSPRRAGITFQ